MGLDYGFRDTQKVMAEISDLAGRAIPDEARRREVQKLTARYVALNNNMVSHINASKYIVHDLTSSSRHVNRVLAARR